MGTDYLVLWKWQEAEKIRGKVISRAWGRHSGGLKPGDRMFVWATHANELFLLGAIEVQQSGERWAKGRSLYGLFRIVPLKSVKWRLRFRSRHTASTKLSNETPIALQVRSRRQPTPKTVRLLENVLSSNLADDARAIRAIDGKLRTMTLTKRERDPRIRAIALARRGDCCEVCGFNFAKWYGEFAKYCLEVHHLKPIAGAGAHGRTTTLEDVVVVCPNCHRALHRWSKGASDLKGFRRTCRKRVSPR